MSIICPNCNSSDIKFELALKDYFLSQEEFSVYTCNDCKVSFTHPFPAETELGRYYASEKYLSHDDGKRGLIPFLYRQIKNINISTKYHQVTKALKPGKLLDYGCGIGDFLVYAKQNGWVVDGVEPNSSAREIASQKLDTQVFDVNQLKNFPDAHFDLITLFHVLEHVYSFNKLLPELVRILKPNGRLVIALPNKDSFDAHYYKQYWAGWDVPRHLWHFNPESISLLGQNFQLQKLHQYPMWWDAFYVSLLSEQYKKSSLALLRAFVIGLLSNFKALFNSQYSSLVYVFKNSLNN
ncbi:MAG: class I SAM-dependent methyltransferase [Bacteroidales bacterium]|nr:class I SAM-dependent methyltransferase [Bacteroidales bacterium]